MRYYQQQQQKIHKKLNTCFNNVNCRGANCLRIHSMLCLNFVVNREELE